MKGTVNESELIKKARILLQKGEVEEVRKILESINYSDPSLLLELSNIYRKKKKILEATKCLWKAFYLYKEQELFQNAISVAEILISLGEYKLELLSEIAKLYEKLGYIGDAATTYKQLIKEFEEENDIPGIIDTCKKILELTPKDIEILYNLASLLESSGNKVEASYYYSKLLEIYEEQKNTTGIENIKQKLIELSAIDLNKLIDHTETIKETIEHIEGRILPILTQKTDNYALHYDIGITLFMVDEFPEALQHFKISANNKELRIKSLEMIIRCYINLENYEEAERTCKKAIEKFPSEDTFLYLLTKIYIKLDDKKNAALTLNRILRKQKVSIDKENITELVKSLKALF